MIVVDASVLLEVLLRSPAGRLMEGRLFTEPQQTLHAPHLVDAEVAQALRRYAALGNIDAERGRAAIADLVDFPVRRYPHEFLLTRVWEMRSNITVYDGLYVVLAEALDATLLTRDRRLAAAATHHAHVELV